MGGLFSNPKTVFLMNYLLQLISGDDNYIMDFFSGSATTAEAVLQSNLATIRKAINQFRADNQRGPAMVNIKVDLASPTAIVNGLNDPFE